MKAERFINNFVASLIFPQESESRLPTFGLIIDYERRVAKCEPRKNLFLCRNKNYDFVFTPSRI